MRARLRWLLAASVAIVVAGIVGVATHDSPASRASAPTTTTTTTRPSHPPSTSTTTFTASGSPGPSSATLEGGLLTPTDMGGYYRIDASSGSAILASAPCLAGLQPAPSQNGRAVEALLGPDEGSVPTIVEAVASYPGTGSAHVYASMVAAMKACASFPLDVGLGSTKVPIASTSIPSAGEPVSGWQGQFQSGGRTESLQVGLVQDGQLVLALLYVDTVPPSAAIMGSFPSTLTAAIGDLA